MEEKIKPKYIKKTNAEQQIVINAIYKRILLGWTTNDIVWFCQHKKNEDGEKIKDWVVGSARQVKRYIAHATKQLRDIELPDLEQARSEAVETYKYLLSEASKRGSLAECRKIRARLDKIQGLESENININATGNLKIDELKIGIMKVHNEAMKEKDV